jgi:hypothetical protein
LAIWAAHSDLSDASAAQTAGTYAAPVRA